MATFDELIAEIDSGSLNSNLTQEMRGLTECMNARAQDSGGAKGEITLKLKFSAEPNGRVEIAADVKITRPGPPGVTETRWIGDKGALVQADPRQTALPLRTPARNTNES